MSAGADCSSDDEGCTVAVLEAAAQLTCGPGYGGSPDKANAACDTDGGTFSGATFCSGLCT